MSEPEERRVFHPENAQIKEPPPAPTEPPAKLTPREELEALSHEELVERMVKRNEQSRIASIALHQLCGRLRMPDRQDASFCCLRGNEISAYALRDMRLLGDFPGSHLGRDRGTT